MIAFVHKSGRKSKIWGPAHGPYNLNWPNCVDIQSLTRINHAVLCYGMSM